MLRQTRSLSDTLLLLAADDDPFCRWDAAQSLFRDVLLARASGQTDEMTEDALVGALQAEDRRHGPGEESELASLLSMPGPG